MTGGKRIGLLFGLGLCSFLKPKPGDSGALECCIINVLPMIRCNFVVEIDIKLKLLQAVE